MDAGPQGMKVASWRSRMRRRDLCTYEAIEASAFDSPNGME